MVTRSGTNQFRGSAFVFRRDPALDATEWETNLVCDPKTSRTPCKQPFYQTIGGFGLGGPIKRNKTFFYGNLQMLRATVNREVTRTVYTEAARQGIWRYVIGGRNQPAGVTGASVDANGNVLPGITIGTYNVAANDPDRIGLNPETQRLIALMPLPNLFTTGDGLNYAGLPLQLRRRRGAVRLRGPRRPQPERPALRVRPRGVGPAEHAVRQRQRRRAALPGRAVRRQHLSQAAQRGRQLALEPLGQRGQRVRVRRQPLLLRLPDPVERREQAGIDRTDHHRPRGVRSSATSGR